MSTASGTEAGLIESARAGDEAAFDALVGPLIEPAYKLALVMLRDSEEAQDAVQETCLKAWRKLPQLRPDSSMRPWFFTILANHCRTVRRNRWWSVVKVPTILGREDFPGGEVDSDLDLNRALGKLSGTDRAAVFLFFSLDVPLVEVARILKISPQAAKSRVHRAVVKLRLNMVEVAG